MERLTTNIVGRPKRITRNQRDYIVAPMSLITPGVLNGSAGPLYYPREEIARDPSAWNDVAITLGHPKDTSGQRNVSGRDPAVLDRVKLGRVYNARIDHRGRLVAEGWFHVESLRRVAPQVLAALEAGSPIELSTGLRTTNEPAPGGATFNGRPYTHVARDYKPDHLAILPGQKGACSVEDGCGVFAANEAADLLAGVAEALRQLNEPPPTGEPVFNESEFTASTDDGGANERGEAMSVKLNNEERERIITSLVTNCDCNPSAVAKMPWAGRDRAALNAMSDEALIVMDDTRRALALNSTPPRDLPGLVMPDGSRHVWNDRRQSWDVYPAPAQPNAPAPQQQPTPANNATATPATPVAQPANPPVAQPAPRTRTAEEWAAEKFPGKSLAQVEQVIRNACDAEQKEVATLVERLTANLAGDARQVMQDTYATMGVDKLRVLAANLPNDQQQQDDPERQAPVQNFAGAAGAPVARPGITKHLEVPAYNFAARN
jgi:hypothetical protein